MFIIPATTRAEIRDVGTQEQTHGGLAPRVRGPAACAHARTCRCSPLTLEAAAPRLHARRARGALERARAETGGADQWV